jgi:hypothetical protein
MRDSLNGIDSFVLGLGHFSDRPDIQSRREFQMYFMVCKASQESHTFANNGPKESFQITANLMFGLRGLNYLRDSKNCAYLIFLPFSRILLLICAII